MLHRQSFSDRTQWCQGALARPARPDQGSMATGGQGGGEILAGANAGERPVADRAARNRRRADWRGRVIAAACLLPAVLLIGATLTALVASGPALAKMSSAGFVHGEQPTKSNAAQRPLLALAARRLTSWIVLGPGL